jgi:hypothetical protein
MVISRLIGGLGNQMFQYAAGKSLSVANGYELKLDISAYKNYTLHNGFELDLFKISAGIASDDEVSGLVNVRSRIFRFLSKKLGLKNKSHFLEKSFSYDPDFFNIKHSVYIDGYWQSYQYFESIESELRVELTPIKKLSGLNLDVSQQISRVNAVSLHIRRGDYVSNQTTNKVHGFLGIDYYENAIKTIFSRVPDPYFFVFSDDIAWARENLPLTNNVTFIEHNRAENSYEDMRLMSLCKHHIIANSSFSWWGAWLGQNPNKIVLYPLKWFAKDDRDISKLCPPEWHMI